MKVVVLLVLILSCGICVHRLMAEEKKPALKQLRFVLPEYVYAVPGVETNIYFANVFLAINPDNYVYDVDCTKGINRKKRWTYTPADGDVGSYPLTLSVYDDEGLVAQGTTTVIVSSKEAGKGRSISLLVVGDSLTNANVYPTRIHELMQGENNPAMKMVGSHRGSGNKPLPGGVAHEGYGGWTWATFMNRYIENPTSTRPVDIFYAKSKFLTKKEGKVVFDMRQYVDIYNDGKMPDFITFQLGVNDIHGADDATLEERSNQVVANMISLLTAMRAAAPDAIMGVGLVTLGADQDAFGENYKCGRTSWQYKKNVFMLNSKMMAWYKQQKDDKIVLIPTTVNLDCEHNFPVKKAPATPTMQMQLTYQSNGVHPAPAGYRQIGDTFYAWLKAQLAK